MDRSRIMALGLVVALSLPLLLGVPAPATAQARPDGEMRFAMIYDYVWPSGVGPRVAEPALLLIDPYPWAAPYEELRLKK